MANNMRNYQNQKYLSKVAIREEACLKIFLERDKILGRPQSSTCLSKRTKCEPKIADFNKIQEELKYVLENPIQEEHPVAAKPSSMFVSPSRNQFFVKEETAPPVGNYNVNYNLVQRNIFSTRIQQPKHNKKKISSPKMCTKHKRTKKRAINNVKKGHTFEKLPRTNSLVMYQIEPKYSSSLSKIKSPVSPKLNKATRKFDALPVSTNIRHVYSPNKELPMNKLSLNHPVSKVNSQNSKKIKILSINTNYKSNANSSS